MTFKQPLFKKNIYSAAGLWRKKEEKPREKEELLQLKGNENTVDDQKDIQEKSPIQKYLDYLCVTAGVEVDSTRVKKLQKIADDMTAGTNKQVRIVILNKGKSETAFALEDGTICVGQSLLNKLDYMDEIAGVIAHETGHIINKTHKRGREVNPRHEFGFDWVHEAAADQLAADLLRKAGYNSQGLIFAIEKISGYERGFEHQSGVARASEGVIGHFLIDYQTSNKDMAIKSTEYKKSVEMNQLEKTMEKIKWFKAQELQKILPTLHPRDLETSFKKMMAMQNYSFAPSFNFQNEQQKLIDVYYQFFKEKLKEEKIKEEYIDVYISSLAQYYQEKLYRHPLKNFDNLVKVLKNFDGKNDYRIMNKFSKILFDREQQVWEKTPKGAFLDGLSQNIFDKNVYPNKLDGISLNKEQLIELCILINNSGDKIESGDYDRDRLISELTMSYSQSTYLVLAENFEENKEAIKEQLFDLWQSMTEAGEGFKKYSFSQNDQHSLISTGIWEKMEIEEKLDKRNGKENQTKCEMIEQEKIARVYFLKECFDEFCGKSLERISAEKITEFVNNFLGDKINNKERLSRDFFQLFEEDFGDKKPELKLTKNERIELINFLAKEIDRKKIQVKYDFAWILGGKEAEEQNYQDNLELNERLLKLDLKLNLCVFLFKHDGPEFYQFIEEAIKASGIDLQNLNRIQIVNLSRTLLNLGHLKIYDNNGEKKYFEPGKNDSYPGNNYAYLYQIDEKYTPEKIKIKMMDKFAGLSIIQTLQKKNEEMRQLEVDNLEELDTKIQSFLKKILSYHSKKSNSIYDKEDPNEAKYNIFSSELKSLLLFDQERNSFQRIIDGGVPEKKYDELYDFIKKYYPGGKKYLKAIRKKYLESVGVGLGDKTNYLIKNFDEIGIEGMIMVGEEINEMKDYLTFRDKMGHRLEKYLEGSGIVEIAANIDFLSTFFVKDFEELLATCSTHEKNIQETTEHLGRLWAQIFLKNESYYNKLDKKFYLDDNSRIFFRSLKDIVEEIKNLSYEKKLSLVHKALTESNGALSSKENRKKLGEILINSLGIKTGFVAEALKSACLKADAKYIAFPISQMLAKLLFRSYDLDKIDYQNMQGYVENEFSDKEIMEIYRASTDDLKEFGNEYKDFPDIELTEMAKSSNSIYEECQNNLDRILDIDNDIKEKQEEKFDSTEAIISACERNPLSVRTLQLLVQLRKFDKKTEERLSKSLDANEGLNKLLFWENLYRFTQQNSEINNFNQSVKKVGKKAGGGSLFTTYLATNVDNKEIVIKMLNPNAEAFINASWNMLHDTLDDVISKNRGQIRKEAQLGKLLVDTSQNWCINDVNYHDFLEKDNRFREIIERFNRDTNLDLYKIPKVVFEEIKLKSEEKSPGTTVNQILNDENISMEQKKNLVNRVMDSFMTQLKNETEKEKYLIHSDPHIGNYMADFNGDKVSEIGIIDRNMYLEFEQKDIDIFKKFSQGDNYNFITSFVNRVLDINKNRGIARQYKYALIMGQILTDYSRVRLRGKEDSFYVFQQMMAKMAENKLDVPLKYRLMIRNIQAFKELAKKYDIDFAQYQE